MFLPNENSENFSTQDVEFKSVFLEGKESRFIVYLDAIVKGAVIWPADEQALNLMG